MPSTKTSKALGNAPIRGLQSSEGALRGGKIEKSHDSDSQACLHGVIEQEIETGIPVRIPGFVPAPSAAAAAQNGETRTLRIEACEAPKRFLIGLATGFVPAEKAA